ncbi:MAG: trypsin-like peptidase domain-containing protein [Planctomycetota bacterium]
MLAVTTGWISLTCAVFATTASSSDAILLEFSSPSCGPCQAMRPIISEMVARGVAVRQIDTTTEPHLARRYGIRQTPTYVVVSGGKELTRLTGMQSARDLQAALSTNPAGPIVDTGSEFAPVNRSVVPQTRLTPLAAHTSGLTRDAGQSIGQQRQVDWNNATGVTRAALPPSGSPRQPPAAIRSEVLPSVSLADAIERARAATVRMRVYDGRGYGAGTGTIIDTHGDEALVLTCGHLFRDGQSDDRIEVDLFVAGEVVTVEGTLIDFDADQRDIGLVAIRPGVEVTAVEVIQDGAVVRTGQPAFSFGCDRGDDPSRRDTRITGVDKYNQNIDASNLEIEGAPIDGRSGGGLFDESGTLIGVCNAADYKSDIGIYTGPGSVHWQLDRIDLARLYKKDVVRDRTNAPPATLLANTAASESTRSPSEQAFAGFDDQASEVIVIFRNSSGGRDQVVTLNEPDARLVQQIRSAARR